MNQPIYHLASPADIDKLKQTGRYSAPSLNTEGFIHCCTNSQLPGVIQRYYIDATELVLLHIDTTQLSETLTYENTVGGTELFPHIYGVINVEAVVKFETLDNSAIARIAASNQYEP